MVEIKVFKGINTYFNEKFQAPALVKIYTDNLEAISVKEAKPPYLVLNSQKDMKIKIEIEPLIIPKDALEEEKEKVEFKILKLEELEGELEGEVNE